MPARFDAAEPASQQGEWDTSGPPSSPGKVRAVYDVPEIDSGYGVWRSSVWANQYAETMKVPATDISTAIVLRHNGIVLAMQQAYWDKYGVGQGDTA